MTFLGKLDPFREPEKQVIIRMHRLYDLNIAEYEKYVIYNI